MSNYLEYSLFTNSAINDTIILTPIHTAKKAGKKYAKLTLIVLDKPNLSLILIRTSFNIKHSTNDTTKAKSEDTK